MTKNIDPTGSEVVRSELPTPNSELGGSRSELPTPNSELRRQLAITGRGGQGVLFLAKILSECALESGQEVIASETHGMAVRGGSVISTLKVGGFQGPLIRSGQADVMLALDEGSLQTFSHLLSPQGVLFLNACASHDYPCIDATGLAAGMGFPVVANLVLLGFAFRHKERFFCGYDQIQAVTARLSPERFREVNLRALALGFSTEELRRPR